MFKVLFSTFSIFSNETRSSFDASCLSSEEKFDLIAGTEAGTYLSNVLVSKDILSIHVLRKDRAWNAVCPNDTNSVVVVVETKKETIFFQHCVGVLGHTTFKSVSGSKPAQMNNEHYKMFYDQTVQELYNKK